MKTVKAMVLSGIAAICAFFVTRRDGKILAIEFVPLRTNIVLEVLGGLPEPVRAILQANPQLVLAGGVIRDVIAGCSVKDIDIFCPDTETASRCALGLGTVRRSRYAFNVRVCGMPVQFIYFGTFRSVEELVSQLTFAHAAQASTTIPCDAIGVASL